MIVEKVKFVRVCVVRIRLRVTRAKRSHNNRFVRSIAPFFRDLLSFGPDGRRFRLLLSRFLFKPDQFANIFRDSLWCVVEETHFFACLIHCAPLSVKTDSTIRQHDSHNSQRRPSSSKITVSLTVDTGPTNLHRSHCFRSDINSPSSQGKVDPNQEAE